MKKILLSIIVLTISIVANAQYEWMKIHSPTTVNLRTAMILPNGDIYVFGDSAKGFKTSDDGKTWENLSGIDDTQKRSITTCGFNGKTPYIAGSKGLAKFYSAYDDWREINITGVWDVYKLDMDSVGDIWYLPYDSYDGTYGGIAYRSEAMRYGQVETQRLYNFYLPPELNSRYPRSTYYISCLAGNRILTFLGNAENDGVISYGYLSDDLGKNWKSLNFEGKAFWPFAVIYINSISFNGPFGIMVGCHHGGWGAQPVYTMDKGVTWHGYPFKGTLTIPQSVYADFDTTYRAITVGSIYDNYDSLYDRINGKGFIQIDSAAPVIINNCGLNYVGGQGDKFIIVGDSGTIFIGQRAKDTTTSTISSANTEKLSVYPNPAVDMINLQLPSQQTEVKIFNLSGVMVDTFFASGEIERRISLQPSIYFINAGGKMAKLVVK